MLCVVCVGEGEEGGVRVWGCGCVCVCASMCLCVCACVCGCVWVCGCGVGGKVGACGLEKGNGREGVTTDEAPHAEKTYHTRKLRIPLAQVLLGMCWSCVGKVWRGPQKNNTLLQEQVSVGYLLGAVPFGNSVW